MLLFIDQVASLKSFLKKTSLRSFFEKTSLRSQSLTTHTHLKTKLTSQTKYTKIQNKVPTRKTTQNALKYKAKILYYQNGQNTRPQRRKHLFYYLQRIMDPTLAHGLRNLLRFMRTLGPSLATLAQSYRSLQSNTLWGQD